LVPGKARVHIDGMETEGSSATGLGFRPACRIFSKYLQHRFQDDLLDQAFIAAARTILAIGLTTRIAEVHKSGRRAMVPFSSQRP